MSVANIVEPAAPKTDASNESPKLPLGALFRRKSAFSRKLKFFQRDMTRLREIQKKIKEDKESEEAKKFTDIIIGYKMLRALCISHNWITGNKEEDKRFIPSKFLPKLKTILGDQCIEKMSEAMKMTNAEVTSHVHKEIKPQVMDDLLKFIEDNEKASVSDVLEKAIEEMSQELEARKDEPRPPKSKKSPRASKKSPRGSSKSISTEDKFRDLMKEIKSRIGTIKFSKDDFQTYSDTQSEIDALLYEATNEIHEIKKLTQERFDRVQKGRSGGQRRRSNVRRPRDDSKNDLKMKKSASVFSKEMIHEDSVEAMA